jgi:uncharacterized protein (DUF1501 family)
MKRRDFLNCLGGAGLLAWRRTVALAAAGGALPAPADPGRAQGRQRRAQYRGALHRPELLRAAPAHRHPAARCCRWATGHGLHPALQPLLPLWQAGELAWCRASATRKSEPVAFPLHRDMGHGVEQRRIPAAGLAGAQLPRPAAAGRLRRRCRGGRQPGHGPLSGGGRVVALNNPEQFARLARLAQEGGGRGGGALAHIRRGSSPTLFPRRRNSMSRLPALPFAASFPVWLRHGRAARPARCWAAVPKWPCCA